VSAREVRIVPHRETAEALLARWREAERRHASTAPGTPEFEETRREIVEIRHVFREATEEIQESPERLVPQPVD
jgi:hypothetical protein